MLADAVGGALTGGVIGLLVPGIGTVAGLIIGGFVGHYYGKKNR